MGLPHSEQAIRDVGIVPAGLADSGAGVHGTWGLGVENAGAAAGQVVLSGALATAVVVPLAEFIVLGRWLPESSSSPFPAYVFSSFYADIAPPVGEFLWSTAVRAQAG